LSHMKYRWFVAIEYETARRPLLFWLMAES